MVACVLVDFTKSFSIQQQNSLRTQAMKNKNQHEEQRVLRIEHELYMLRI